MLLLASIPLAMQREQVSIDGFITNQNGPIAKASVEARNVMSGSVARVQSDAVRPLQTGESSSRALFAVGKSARA